MKFLLSGNLLSGKYLVLLIVISFHGGCRNSYAIEDSTRVSKADYSRDCLRRSEFLLKNGKPDSALIILSEVSADPGNIKTGYPALAYQIISMKASANALLGNWNEALAGFRESLTLCEPNSGYMGEAYMNIATLFALREDYEDAIENYKHSLLIFTSASNDRNRIIQLLFSLCSCFSKTGDKTSFELFCKEAERFSKLSSYKSYSCPVNPSESFRGICRQAETGYRTGRKNPDTAAIKSSWISFNHAIKLYDSVNLFLGHKGSRLLFNENAKQAFTGAVEAGFSLYGNENADALFSISESSRNTILNSMVTDKYTELSTLVPDSIRLLKKKLLYNLSSGMKMDQSQLNELHYWFELRQEIDSLNERIKGFVPGSASIEKHEIINAGVIRSSLRSDEALLEYMMCDSVLFIFCLTAENISVQRIILPPKFNIAVTEFKTMLRTGEMKGFIDGGNFLFRYLVKPVLPFIDQKKHLIIIPDDVITLLPFECLIMDKDLNLKMNYLIEKYEVSYAFSASAWYNAPVQKYPAGVFGGFAPVFSEAGNSYSSLIYSEKEIKDAADILGRGGVKAVIKCNESATERSFKNSASSFSIIHVATHSIIDEKDPESSGLVLNSSPDLNDSVFSEDGILYHDEIINLDLHTDLLVLSACGSGKGKLTRTEGVLALNRAFYVAGAKNIIYSAWNISDQRTPDLMKTFYTHLLGGDSYSAALREAKLSMISHRETSLPFFWGGVMLLGK